MQQHPGQPNEPSQLSTSKIRQGVQEIFGGWQWLRDFIDDAWIKVNNLTETNYQLGVMLARQGRVSDAIFRFRVTLWIAPEHEPTMYNLACLYHHIGNDSRALALLGRIIKRNPRHHDALYMIASINPELLKPHMRPTMVPPLQIAEYFDNFAGIYDQTKAQEMYKLPALVHQILRPLLPTELTRRTLLDIGCGTGLCGIPFAADISNILGIDLSNGMLDVAYTRMDRRGIKIYNRLVQKDIRSYLALQDIPRFDVVLAIEVLPFLGEIESLANGLAAHITSGGYVALTFDIFPEDNSYGVMPQTGYFGHGLSYVESVMHQAGFTSVRTGEVEASAMKRVELCVFQLPDTPNRVQHDDHSPNRPD